MAFSLSIPQESLLERLGKDSIFLEGPAGAGKTTAAASGLLKMISGGIPGGSILVLTPQRSLGLPYDQVLRGPDLFPGGLPALMTFGGLARRMLVLFWPLAADAAGFASPGKQPVFLTLETAQYAIAHLIRPLMDESRLFDSVVIDRNRIYSQVLDNLNKAAVVGFPHGEIGQRLKDAWVGEPGQLRVYDDVQACASAFRAFCLEHNLLDFSLQFEIFRDVLWQLPECRGYLKRTYRHLIADNLEEETPVAHDLLRDWLPDFESALLVYDWQAGFRRFLGADPRSAYALKSICSHSRVFSDSLVQSKTVWQLEALLKKPLLLQGQPHFLFEGAEEATTEEAAAEDVAAADTAAAQASLQLNLKYTRFYPEMLDWAAETIRRLVLEEEVPAGEIVVLSPYLSDALRFSLVQRLVAEQIPVRSHRPSRSLREEPTTGCLLTLAALAHPAWGIRPTRYDLAYALLQAIEGLDLVRAQLLAEITYQPKGEQTLLTSFDLIRPDMQERITFRVGERFERLRTWLAARQDSEAELDHFLARLFGELLSQPGFGFHTSFDGGQVAANLIESVQSFRWMAGPFLEEAQVPVGQEYIHMVQDGLIAAQYLGGWQTPPRGAVLLAPATTFLMANRPVAVQIWLDAGSRGWSERLNQPLTHPYVLSRGWPPGRPWTDADEYAVGRETLRRLVHGLLKRCRSSVYLGLSELGEQGYEQRGPLLSVFQRLLRDRQAQAGGQ